MAANEARNENRTIAGLRGQRREEATDGDGVVQAYEDEFGVDRSVQGDQDAPHLKVPPFPSDVVALDRFAPGTARTLDAAQFVSTNEIDVKTKRLLSLWVAYTATVGSDDVLSIVPQASRVPNSQFYTIAVIDPAISPVVGIGAPFAANEVFAVRDIYPALLRTVSPGGGAGGTLIIPLVFDVAAYTQFRLLLSDGTATGQVILDYNFAE